MFVVTDYLIELGWSEQHEAQADAKIQKPVSGVWLFNEQRIFVQQAGDSLSGHLETSHMAKVSGVIQDGKLSMNLFWTNGSVTTITSKRRVGSQKPVAIDIEYETQDAKDMTVDKNSKARLKRKQIPRQYLPALKKLIGNIRIISSVYKNINFDSLAAVLNLEVSQVESLMGCMVRSGLLDGMIDEETGLLTFGGRSGAASLEQFGTRIEKVCQSVNAILSSIVQSNPQRYVFV